MHNRLEHVAILDQLLSCAGPVEETRILCHDIWLIFRSVGEGSISLLSSAAFFFMVPLIDYHVFDTNDLGTRFSFIV